MNLFLRRNILNYFKTHLIETGEVKSEKGDKKQLLGHSNSEFSSTKMHFNPPSSITKLLRHDEPTSQIQSYQKFQSNNFVCLENIHCIQYLKEDNVLIAGTESGAILVINSKSKCKEASVKHAGPIANLRHHNNFFIALSLNGEMSFWKFNKKNAAPEFRGWLNHKEPPLGLFVSAINQYYIVACKSMSFCHKHKISLWKRQDENEMPNVLSVESSKSDILCVQLDAGHRVYCGLKSGQVLIFDARSLHSSREVQVSSHPIWSIAIADALGSNDEVFVAARNDGVFRFDRDLNVFQLIRPFEDIVLQLEILDDHLYCLTNYGQLKRFSFECLDATVKHKQTLEWSKQFGLDERKDMAYHSISNYPNFQLSEKQAFVVNPDDTHVIKLIELDASSEEIKNNRHYYMKMYFNH